MRIGLPPRSTHCVSSAASAVDKRQALARVCGERDIEFLDLTVQFSGPDNRLEPSLTDDGLHPNGAGHQRWAELLREVLES